MADGGRRPSAYNNAKVHPDAPAYRNGVGRSGGKNDCVVVVRVQCIYIIHQRHSNEWEKYRQRRRTERLPPGHNVIRVSVHQTRVSYTRSSRSEDKLFSVIITLRLDKCFSLNSMMFWRQPIDNIMDAARSVFDGGGGAVSPVFRVNELLF